MSTQIIEFIKSIFIGGVFDDEHLSRDNGGAECLAYMTFQFRLIVSLLMVNQLLI
jgi:hypothetical protein